MTTVTYPGSQSLTFTYDAGGRRIQMVDQSGYTIKYVYTPAGELLKLTDANNIAIVTYTYDAAGRLTRQDNANGTYSTYQYDAAGNVLHLINYAPGGGVNSRFDYSYNLLGQVAGMATLDGAWTYTYDAAGQLTRAIFTSTNPAIPNQDLAYNYDPAGNRTSTVINGVTTAYTANAMNEYTSIGTALRQYDSDGNLLNDGTSTYTYNQLDELTGVTNAQGTTQYTYNALGQRVAQTAGGQTTQYLIDPVGLGNVVSQYDGTGTLLGAFQLRPGVSQPDHRRRRQLLLRFRHHGFHGRAERCDRRLREQLQLPALWSEPYVQRHRRQSIPICRRIRRANGQSESALHARPVLRSVVGQLRQ